MKLINQQKHNFGFTLLELLVVIAIIGLLATIIMINLNNARDKAKDTLVKHDMSQLQKAAALIYDRDGAYTKLCDGTIPDSLNTSEEPALLGAIDNDLHNQGSEITECLAGNIFAVEATLPSDHTKAVCADSTGCVGLGRVGMTMSCWPCD